MALVLGVVICFCIELSYIEGVSVEEVFKGYIPSSSIVEAQGYVLHYCTVFSLVGSILIRSSQPLP